MKTITKRAGKCIESLALVLPYTAFRAVKHMNTATTGVCMSSEVGCSQMLATVQLQTTSLQATHSQPRLTFVVMAMFGDLPSIGRPIGRSCEQILWADVKHHSIVKTGFYCPQACLSLDFIWASLGKYRLTRAFRQILPADPMEKSCGQILWGGFYGQSRVRCDW